MFRIIICKRSGTPLARIALGLLHAVIIGNYTFNTTTCLMNIFNSGAHGILIVYDITDRESFENVRTWMTEIEK